MFNHGLLVKELREQRWLLISASLLLSMMGIAAALTWYWRDTLLAMMEGVGGFELFMGELTFTMQNITTYIWSQWNPKNLLQIGTLVAVILGSQSVAGELSRGSFDFLVSRPLSRTNILLHKIGAGIITISVSIWISTLAILVTGSIIDSLNWLPLIQATVLTNVGLIAVLAVATLFSVHSRDPVKAGALCAGLLFVYSGLGLLAKTHKLSLFWHMKGIPWFVGTAPFPWLSIAGLAALAAALFWLAVIKFNQREY